MSKVLKGAGMLAICALIAKLLGALYRIPLTNIIGAEGMGLYQMVFPLYTVLLTISSGGLPVAISKVVSQKIAKKDESGAREVLFVSIMSLLIAGGIGTLIIICFRDKIALLQGNSMAALPYLGIAPAVVFVAVISCFRGYYQGKQNMLPSALSQIIEQVIKLVVGLFLSRLLLPYGIEWAVLGALIGITVSEFIAMIVLVIQFAFFTNKKYKKSRKINALDANFEVSAELSSIGVFEQKSKKSILKEIYAVAIPVTLGSLVMPLTQIIDSILVINLLVVQGFTKVQATSLFGLVTGPVNSLINMPVVLTLSLAVAILPQIASNFEAKKDIAKDVDQGMRFSVVIGVLCTLIFMVFAKPILTLLYSKGLSKDEINLGATILKISSLSVFYVSILQIATTVLQGTGKAQKPALNLVFGSVFKILATVALVPLLGVIGAVVGTVICYGVTCFLDVKAMIKSAKLKFNFKSLVLGPLVASFAFIVVGLTLNYVLNLIIPFKIAVAVSAILSTVVFILIVFAFKTINSSELMHMPLIGKHLVKFQDKLNKIKSKRKSKNSEKSKIENINNIDSNLNDSIDNKEDTKDTLGYVEEITADDALLMVDKIEQKVEEG